MKGDGVHPVIVSIPGSKSELRKAMQLSTLAGIVFFKPEDKQPAAERAPITRFRQVIAWRGGDSRIIPSGGYRLTDKNDAPTQSIIPSGGYRLTDKNDATGKASFRQVDTG